MPGSRLLQLAITDAQRPGGNHLAAEGAKYFG
jgi:hypothetical protein